VNVTELKELIVELIQLIATLKTTRAEDPAPETEKVGVWTVLIWSLFGKPS